MPIPATAKPPPAAPVTASQRMPPSFFPPMDEVVRPLEAGLEPGGLADGVRRGQPDGEGQDMGEGHGPAAGPAEDERRVEAQPGGECQARPFVPRPRVCSAARTAVPWAAPCKARVLASSFVEATVVRTGGRDFRRACSPPGAAQAARRERARFCPSFSRRSRSSAEPGPVLLDHGRRAPWRRSRRSRACARSWRPPRRAWPSPSAACPAPRRDRRAYPGRGRSRKDRRRP